MPIEELAHPGQPLSLTRGFDVHWTPVSSMRPFVTLKGQDLVKYIMYLNLSSTGLSMLFRVISK